VADSQFGCCLILLTLTAFADDRSVLRRSTLGGREDDLAIGDNTGMTFERVAWIVTVFVALLTALLLLLAGYTGYAGLSTAVAAAAAINLY
jgi:hypothetical protein